MNDAVNMNSYFLSSGPNKQQLLEIIHFLKDHILENEIFTEERELREIHGVCSDFNTQSGILLISYYMNYSPQQLRLRSFLNGLQLTETPVKYTFEKLEINMRKITRVGSCNGLLSLFVQKNACVRHVKQFMVRGSVIYDKHAGIYFPNRILFPVKSVLN